MIVDSTHNEKIKNVQNIANKQEDIILIEKLKAKYGKEWRNVYENMKSQEKKERETKEREKEIENINRTLSKIIISLFLIPLIGSIFIVFYLVIPSTFISSTVIPSFISFILLVISILPYIIIYIFKAILCFALGFFIFKLIIRPFFKFIIFTLKNPNKIKYFFKNIDKKIQSKFENVFEK